MNLSRPSQCLLCSFARTSTRTSRARQKFHTSAPQLARKRPKHPNIKASDLSQSQTFSPRKFRPEYSAQDLAALEQKYSPAQLEAIKAAESAVPASDIDKAAQRADPWSLNYFDDLSEIHPVVDKPLRAPWSATDPNPKLKTTDQLAEDLAKFFLDPKFPRDEMTKEHWRKGEDPITKFTQANPPTVSEMDPRREVRSAMAPELTPTKPKRPAKKEKKDGGAKRDEEEASPALVRLMQMTGYTRQQIAGLRVKSIISHRVVNQTRLGKIGKQYFLSIAGNGQGLIGIGEGKAEEPQEARLQSQYRAIRNMQPILRYEGRTIYGDVKGKVSATELELYARPPGEFFFLDLRAVGQCLGPIGC
jgi:small subunit ribosomal protein S5